MYIFSFLNTPYLENWISDHSLYMYVLTTKLEYYNNNNYYVLKIRQITANGTERF